MKHSNIAKGNFHRVNKQYHQTVHKDVGDYSPHLKKAGIDFSEKDKYLVSGNFKFKGWLIYISVIPRQAEELLTEVLPFLKEQQAAFQLIKNQEEHRQLNEGAYKLENVGKNIIISPSTDEEAVMLAKGLAPLTEKYTGVEVIDALRLSQNVYAEFSTPLKGNDQVEYYKLYIPEKARIPFTLDKRFTQSKNGRFVGKLYLLMNEIANTYKGSVHKAINLKKLSCTWCLVKHGRANAACDTFGRTIRERLLWQQKVLAELQSVVTTARFIDYFEKHGDSFLIIDWADGTKLMDMIPPYYKEKDWKELDRDTQVTLIKYFLALFDTIHIIHEHGYVHRDITPMNFIIDPSGKVTVIDFELAFSLKEGIPIPPFGMGTIGYVSPEQMRSAKPTLYEDVYALGAVLIFILTGKHKEFRDKTDLNLIKIKLKALAGDNKLVNLALRCIRVDATSRPTMADLRKGITDFLQE
ncbi:MAG: protein kinase [Chitinophagaceae bacterium]